MESVHARISRGVVARTIAQHVYTPHTGALHKAQAQLGHDYIATKARRLTTFRVA